MNMEITEIAIHPTNDGLVRAYVDIVFDNCLKVEEIKVIQGPTVLFVSFPAKKQRDGSHRQLAYPANAETRMKMQRVILAEYEKIVGSNGSVQSSRCEIALRRRSIQSCGGEGRFVLVY
jgi:stage V sporulation protein G